MQNHASESATPMGWPHCSNAKYTLAKKTILQTTHMGQVITWWSEEVIQGHSQGLSQELWIWLCDMGDTGTGALIRTAHIRKGAVLYEQSRIETAQSKHGMCKFGVTTPNVHIDYLCPTCSRVFWAHIGLINQSDVLKRDSSMLMSFWS